MSGNEIFILHYWLRQTDRLQYDTQSELNQKRVTNENRIKQKKAKEEKKNHLL